ncbi:hypothetical protein BGZ51_004090 [Haplosporangium sp. Z 767]|nr:hypothetical protein BGZ51_004090 [Haplosporangium sp. Z 767]KAF9183559.1 hypothetical protein BGZ50_004141 [Haplosporangium sp. Z 11]
MSATMDSTLPTRPANSASALFSIPELANHVARYLRPIQLSQLCLVSKLFHLVFRPPLRLHLSSFSPSLDFENVQTLGPRIRSLCMDLSHDHFFRQQQALLDTVYTNCADTLTRIEIEFWGDNVAILEDILTRMPGIQELSIVFMSSVDVRMFLKALVSASNANPASGDLRVLMIEIRPTEYSKRVLDWQLLKEVLQSCPKLAFLSLHAVKLEKRTKEMYYSDLANEHLGDLAQLEGLSLEDYSQQPSLDSFPNLKTFRLINSEVTYYQFRSLGLLFPSLEQLIVTGCGMSWIPALKDEDLRMANNPTLDPKGHARILFPELKTIKIFVEYQSGYIHLLDVVRGRPHLVALVTDLVSETRDGIFSMARYCSGYDPSIPSPDSEDSIPQTITENPDMAMNVFDNMKVDTTTTGEGKEGLVAPPQLRNRFKRLGFQLTSRHSYTTEELERFYGAEAFCQLEYIYIQSRRLTLPMFPFAQTLTELCLGGREDLLTKEMEVEVNGILRRFPRLETLRIERYVDNYSVFEALGREPAPIMITAPVTPADGSSPCSVDWLHESPLLIKLGFFIRRPESTPKYVSSQLSSPTLFRTWDVIKEGNGINLTLNLQELERQVVKRFRFLETLTVHVGGHSCLPESEVLEQWQHKMRSAEGRPCQVYFKVR